MMPKTNEEAALLFVAWNEQVYSFENERGEQFHWLISKAHELAEARGDLGTISLSELGMTLPILQRLCTGLDLDYALTTDLNEPLLFVTLEGKIVLADGNHRCAKALLLGVDVLLAYILTEDESEAALIHHLPAGQGLNWGQNRSPDSPCR